MKICPRCSEEKPIDDFSQRTLRSGTVIRQTWCKKCHKEYHAEHYRKNRSTYRKKAIVRNGDVAEFIRSLKDKPCADCEVKYPYYVMEFDHLGEKEFSIGNATRLGFSKERILSEVEKCDVVCANCHRERTEQRRAS